MDPDQHQKLILLDGHPLSMFTMFGRHLLIHFSTHLSHHPHSRHRSLLLSFTPGTKPTFSTNPSHLRFLLPTGLPHDNGTGLDLLRSSFYFLVSHFNFLFIPCDRLSWLPVSFLLHVKYPLSYRIVYVCAFVSYPAHRQKGKTNDHITPPALAE